MIFGATMEQCVEGQLVGSEIGVYRTLEEPHDSLSVGDHGMRLHNISSVEQDALAANDPNNVTVPKEVLTDKISCSDQLKEIAVNGSMEDTTMVQGNLDVERKNSSVLETGDSLDILVNDSFQSQDSFRRQKNYIEVNSPVHDGVFESAVSGGHDSLASSAIDQHQSSIQEQIFIITDVSPAWASSTETTEILVAGYFLKEYLHLADSNLFCVCGDACVPANIVEVGLYYCSVLPHSCGFVCLYLSLDGHKPVSQVLNFEYRACPLHDPLVSSKDDSKWEEFQCLIRLTSLICSTSESHIILSSRVPPTNLKEAKKFAVKTSDISNSMAYLSKSIKDNRISYAQAKDDLFELALRNKLRQWLLARVVEGCKTAEYDAQGQGVIHLCAILGYTWAVNLFLSSGLPLDFPDKHGWTALHWASYCGKEKMVAVLLVAGAKPNLVTDPTSEILGGCTAADLAFEKGYDGLAAYLSEKALVAHFEDSSIARNFSGSLQTSATDTINSGNKSEQEQYLKDTLAACRTAADAAARIQAAFREHTLRARTKADPEAKTQDIVVAIPNEAEESLPAKASSECVSLLANLVLEILSATFDQLSSAHKCDYALISMLMSFLAVFVGIGELFYKGQKEKVTWKRRRAIIGWFYYPPPHEHRPFGSFVDIFGSLCAFLQLIFSIIQYIYFVRHHDNPIKLSLFPIIFAICLVYWKLIKKNQDTHAAHDHIV